MKKMFVSQFLFCLFIVLIQTSCDSEGHGGVSENIEESKQRNVFKSEYKVNPNPYIINDTIKIKIRNAWVENQWAYGKSDDETLIKDKYQLIIEVEGKVLENYGLTWRIGIDGDRYFRSCGRHCLMSDFNQLPNDVEQWKVQNGWRLDSLSKKNIIGSFKIQRKA